MPPKEEDVFEKGMKGSKKGRYDSMSGYEKEKPKGPGLLRSLFGPTDSGPVEYGPKASKDKIRKSAEKKKKQSYKGYPDQVAADQEKAFEENENRRGKK